MRHFIIIIRFLCIYPKKTNDLCRISSGYFSARVYFYCVSVIFFSVYVVLLKTLFFTPTWDFQTSVPSLFYSLTHSGIAWWPFIKQTIFISNLFLIYLIVVVYKRILQL